MKLKIHGEVRHGEPSLCVTCRHATIVQGQDSAKDCGLRPTFKPGLPYFLSGPVLQWVLGPPTPNLHEMEDNSRVLRTDARRKSIGFVQARN
jgi:hypothetical protein